MEVLILVSGYPDSENLYNCTWAHARSLGYLENGIFPVVLNFGAKKSYVYDGISVFSEKDIDKIKFENIKVIVSHSPNMRKHFPFIIKNIDKFEKIYLFCHGSESMYINYDYPKPYSFVSQSLIKKYFRNIYDFFKMKYFKRNFLKYKNMELVFVSNWMKNIFEKNILNLDGFSKRYFIINNSIHPIFYNKNYIEAEKLKGDFITIRRFDDSKYAIDLVVKMAFANPNYRFHLYGKGDYFLYNKKPENVEIFDKFIKPEDMPDLLNQYKCALMPTRCDSQGVMMCEMAVYGIPLITTNIDVTKEMLLNFNNVTLLDYDCFMKKNNFNFIRTENLSYQNNKFTKSLTVLKEVELLKSVN